MYLGQVKVDENKKMTGRRKKSRKEIYRGLE